jgi:CIC family chloride channel protein
MAGGAIGMAVRRVAPFPTGDVGAYALVGMGTLFAGIIRAPMTSVFMIFEITQDYQILVPLMVANMLSFAISKRYQPVPVYHALLLQDHIHLPSPATQAASAPVTARHMMDTDAVFIPPEVSIGEAWKRRRDDEAAAYLVGSGNRLAGLVTRARLAESMAAGRGSQPVSSLLDSSLIHVHPDHPIDVVLERFAQSPDILPVVNRTEARRLEGIITFDSIMSFVRQRTNRRV